MLVCLCRGVSDSEVRSTIRRGASSLSDLANACGAGGDCGSCREMLCNFLDEVSGQQSALEHHAEPADAGAGA